MIGLSFKDERRFHACVKYPWHPRLIDVMWWFLKTYSEAVVTSAYRPIDPGVHGQVPLRAIDLRHWIYTNPKQIEKDINREWAYDPARPQYNVCWLHDVGKGKHFHIQVHDNTQRR